MRVGCMGSHAWAVPACPRGHRRRPGRPALRQRCARATQAAAAAGQAHARYWSAVDATRRSAQTRTLGGLAELPLVELVLTGEVAAARARGAPRPGLKPLYSGAAASADCGWNFRSCTCCAALCCAVLCCAVLRCAVLCWALYLPPWQARLRSPCVGAAALWVGRGGRQGSAPPDPIPGRGPQAARLQP
jgi:hypothetical protein